MGLPGFVLILMTLKTCIRADIIAGKNIAVGFRVIYFS